MLSVWFTLVEATTKHKKLPKLSCQETWLIRINRPHCFLGNTIFLLSKGFFLWPKRKKPLEKYKNDINYFNHVI